MFTDDRFQSKAPVDKRGRKVVKERKHDDMKRYYRLKEEEDRYRKLKGGDAAGEDGSDEEDEDEEEAPVKGKGAKPQVQVQAKKQKKKAVEDEQPEEDEEDGSESESDEESSGEDEEGDEVSGGRSGTGKRLWSLPHKYVHYVLKL
jgi:hypothetical protein